MPDNMFPTPYTGDCHDGVMFDTFCRTDDLNLT
jgi:hypothetical protein